MLNAVAVGFGNLWLVATMMEVIALNSVVQRLDVETAVAVLLMLDKFILRESFSNHN